jgi:hypothetical protein
MKDSDNYIKMIKKEIVLAISISLVLSLVPTTYAQKGNFIVEVTFVDSSRNGPNDVSIYIEEYPQYSRDNIDLIDAMYDDDPTSPDGQYITRIVMPSGLIDSNEDFHVCVVDEDDGSIFDCFEMTNSPKKGPEYLTVRV